METEEKIEVEETVFYSPHIYRVDIDPKKCLRTLFGTPYCYFDKKILEFDSDSYTMQHNSNFKLTEEQLKAKFDGTEGILKLMGQFKTNEISI